MERRALLENASPTWKAGALPLELPPRVVSGLGATPARPTAISLAINVARATQGQWEPGLPKVAKHTCRVSAFHAAAHKLIL